MRIKACATLTMLFASFLLYGCPNVQTCSIKTDALYCDYVVENSSGMVTAKAWFHVGHALGTLLTLDSSCADQVEVNGVALTPDPVSMLLFGYHADISEASEYIFTLTRQGESPYVSIVMPPPRTIVLSPAPTATILDSQESLTILWENNNAADVAEITLSVDTSIGGNSVGSNVRTVPDNGQFVLQGPFLTGSTVSVDLERHSNGLMASGLAGSISATSRSGTWVNVLPAAGEGEGEGEGEGV